jgi:hypothetical protein
LCAGGGEAEDVGECAPDVDIAHIFAAEVGGAGQDFLVVAVEEVYSSDEYCGDVADA